MTGRIVIEKKLGNHSEDGLILPVTISEFQSNAYCLLQKSLIAGLRLLCTNGWARDV